MMDAGNLQEIMNKVSRHLEMAEVAPAPVGALGEMQAFMLLDPLLASLNKQYLDARQTRLQSQKEFGKDDPMTDMALLVEDSAWCAVQTRYMEVRGDRSMMANAQKMMQESLIEERRLVQEQKEREAIDRYRQMEMFARMHEKRKENGADLWLLLLLLYNGDNGLFRFHHATHHFNRLAA